MNTTEKYIFLKNLHDELGHPGIHKLKHTIYNYINVKGILKIIKNICLNCEICNREKDFKCFTGVVTNNYYAKKRNEVVALDIKGPINIKNFQIDDAEREQFYILVITDLYSRFSEICFIWEMNSEIIKSKFEEKWLKIYETPRKCLTDNGRKFLSVNFKTMLKKYKITHIVTAPYNPTGNSVVERINKEIGLILRISKIKTLPEIEKNIWRRLNLTVNMSLGYSTYEIYF
ncbi:hypothetical protein DMUE_3517 [Dictyocoela muelleri]|nr:hypothetical protein DMUE_3517 [Dictyocoela muelleri]